MREATAHRFVDLLEGVAEGRSHLGRAVDLADALGVGGMLRRLTGDRLSVLPPGESLYARLWDETLLDAAREVSARLVGGGVPHLGFKGAALLGRVYRPGDVRIVDVDIFVPMDRRSDAVRLLTAEGWEPQPTVGGPTLPGAPGGVIRRPFSGDAMSAVDVDVHWRVAPVDRLFPWKGTALPNAFWTSLDIRGVLPSPRPGLHAALLVHHFVRHDLLHFRSLFDLAQLLPSFDEPAEVKAFSVATRALGVEHVGAGLLESLSADLGLPHPPGLERKRSTRRTRELASLAYLMALAVDADAHEFEAMTLSRGVRRLRAIDRPIRALPPLLADALLPPAEYLAWRWPESRRGLRLARHLGRVVGRFGKTHLDAR